MSDTDPLVAFAKAVIRMAWEGRIDGGDVQDAAEQHGLLKPAIYDPEKHGDVVESEPGDEILEFAGPLSPASNEERRG